MFRQSPVIHEGYLEKWSAFGQHLDYVPRKPQSINESNKWRCFGVPFESHRNTKLAFFCCPDSAIYQQWYTAIGQAIQQGSQYDLRPNTCAAPAAVGGGANIGFNVPPGSSASNNYYPPQPPPVQPIPYVAPPPAPYQQQPSPQPYYAPPPPPANYPQPYAARPNYQVQQPQPYAATVPAAIAAGSHPPGTQYVGPNGQTYQVVYKDGKKKRKRIGSGVKNAAIGAASGLAGGYLMSRMLGGIGGGFGPSWGGYGGGWGGGCGMRSWGSWSSLSSFSSLSWSD